jgi:hypothetical protein
MLIVEGGGLVEYTPLLVRRINMIPSFSAHDIVQTILLFVVAWQALTLPSVSQMSDNEDAE